MIRCFLVVFLALRVIRWFSPLRHKTGVGRLPGGLRFQFLGRDGATPVTPMIFLRCVARRLSRLLRTLERPAA